ncbi:TLC ATP/ADP transporter isoform X2 [Wolffia australiana]
MPLPSRVEAIVSSIVIVHPREIPALLHSSLCFFFVLSAYFVILPLRDEGAISLGLGNLPSLFVGSLLLTLIAAPLTTTIFSVPNISKGRALVFIHRFFSISLLLFFVSWHASSRERSGPSSEVSASYTTPSEENSNLSAVEDKINPSSGWGNHGLLYVSVRVLLFLWVALMNLITVSSTWARVIDIMDNESGSRLFGFIGAGATFGQLFGSLFAAGMAWLGPYLLLFSALLMELAAQSAKGIYFENGQESEELSLIRDETSAVHVEANEIETPRSKASSSNSQESMVKPHMCVILEGLYLIMKSAYLRYVSTFLGLSAVISSFFYFQKVTIIASSTASSLGRRKLFAEINSLIAVFILVGQLTLTARILTFAGVTTAICAAPVVAFSNLIVIAIWPTWIAVAVSEILRKVNTYVVTRPGRELLFTVVSEEEKYKAKICIDVIVQRLGDATAAGMFKLLFGTLKESVSMISLAILPFCVIWFCIAFHLGQRQSHLAKVLSGSIT